VISEECAVAMARGVRDRLDATWGVATTGVAGPDPQEGKPAGLVYVAVADDAGEEVRELRLDGDRAAVRRATAEAALDLLRDRMGGSSGGRLARGGSV
jgi:PncC family amidohydrolase